ncbi:hypothetical protein BX616_006708 [Lobosporangium transversale]|uniref:N-acetyltransferase domain-containing protein n=1 Tax=Lobosporangium transversale TaxID=64571 RepID=A0A1Y2H1E0_9FUNG|nr:hypothetical protein BCR41DRAFT_345184 [Lobosporangium transversale]KAF9915190.1 hypothetical protein BX616_006708 [Lobosporangium transversale]ORZ28369.1 hypothetical protein BCR41DRAFT_345184 [Lobosporangium transversale]|eukprot:XP_021886054.1 hypothetical protein BCR41DRAFT_345184 [Lobosporangium transversale]
MSNSTAARAEIKSKDGRHFVFDRCTHQQAVDTFYGWSRQEQWNPGAKGEEIRHVFYRADPQGFFFGKLTSKPRPKRDSDSSSDSSSDSDSQNTDPSSHSSSVADDNDGDDEIVSIVSSVRYGDDQAWIGYYIVSPKYRGQGLGLEGFHKALEHAGHGSHVGLDGVMAQVENYKKSGFIHISWQNERRQGFAKDLTENHERDLADQIRRSEIPGLVDLSDDQVDLEQLCELEEKYTGLKRPQFVKDWVKFHTNHADKHRFGAAVLSTDQKKENGKPVVLGYACLRPAETSYRLGPLYAANIEAAKQLLVKLAVEVELADADQQKSSTLPDRPPLLIALDMPNSNQEAVKFFDGIGWKDTFPSLRMWRGKRPEHDVNGVFAVSTLEMG